MNGDSPFFTDYSGGILDTFECNQSVSHAVNIVGYGEEPAKNSDE